MQTIYIIGLVVIAVLVLLYLYITFASTRDSSPPIPPEHDDNPPPDSNTGAAVVPPPDNTSTAIVPPPLPTTVVIPPKAKSPFSAATKTVDNSITYGVVRDAKYILRATSLSKAYSLQRAFSDAKLDANVTAIGFDGSNIVFYYGNASNNTPAPGNYMLYTVR